MLDLRATGTVVKFDGFLTLYQESNDDDASDEDSRRLPEMSQGEKLAKRSIAADQHFTEPPPRYSEASLVKRMEELGIGRPSTYASILQVLRDRKYVRLDKRRLIPEDRGRVVVAFLESYFAKYVEYDFTAGLEEQLDLVSNSEVAWRDLLRDFWKGFIGAIDETKDLKISNVIDTLNELLSQHLFPPREDGSDPRVCPTCGTGQLSLKLSRFGAFIGCSNYPECKHTASLNGSAGEVSNRKLGEDPNTGLEISVRSGRFGPYLQLGEAKDGEKPKRASLPKGVAPDEMDLERAIKLLSLPRDVGAHPEDGELIKAGIGRYGPYVQHGKTYANLEDGDDVFHIGLNRAVTLIAEKIAKPSKGRRFGADPGKPLGDHPTKGGPVVAKNGRYGPYVSHNGVNATLPSDKTPDTVTLAEAVALIDARAGSGPSPHARPRKAKRPSPGTARTVKASSKRPVPCRQTATQEGDTSCRIGSEGHRPDNAARKVAKDAANEWPMKPSRVPSKEELIAFIRDRSGKVSAREIARAFGAKNMDRAAINRMLRELSDDGAIDRQRKRLHHAGTMPPVVLADVTGRDSDGDLLAKPTEWDEAANGEPPVIHVHTPRSARPAEVAGVGDRALIRIEQSRDGETTGRVIKLIDRAKQRALGIFRSLPSGGGRLVPVDKKQLGRELAIPEGRTSGAVDGDLVAVEVSRSGRLGLPMGSVIERLGSIKSEHAVSLIAINAHDIPNVFPRAVLDEAAAAKPAALAGREDWRDVPFVTIDPPDAKDHDDAVHADIGHRSAQSWWLHR